MSESNRTSNQVLSEIGIERRRQIESEGWTSEHDDKHKPGELAVAASVYARNAYIELGDYFIGPRMDAETAIRRFSWPWDAGWWKPKGPRRDLIRAAALIVAEIERLDRHSRPADETTGEQK